MNVKFPNVWQSLVIMLALSLSQLFVSIFIYSISLSFNREINTVLLTGFCNTLVLGGFLFIFVNIKQSSFAINYQIKKFNPYYIIPIIINLIGLIIIISEIDNLLFHYFPIPEYLSNFFKTISSPKEGLFQNILLLSVVAPFTEELLFRGIFLKSFLSQMSKTRSILISSLFFATFHLNPWQFIGAFIFGIIISIWYLKCDSIWPCIIGHAFFNLISLFISTIINLQVQVNISKTDKLMLQPLWLNILGIFLFITPLALLYFGKKYLSIKKLT